MNGLRNGRIRVAAYRVLDQGFWSLSFFVFNLSAAARLDVDAYAYVAVTTVISFIAVAIARAWGINANIIIGAKKRVAPTDAISPAKAAWTSLGVSILVASATIVASQQARPAIGTAIVVVFLGAAMTAVDMPRQVLIYAGRHQASLGLAITYVIMSASVAAIPNMPPTWLLTVWALVNIVVSVAGWLLVSRGQGPTQIKITGVGVPLRLAAEALYVGVGSQLSTVLTYTSASPHATAGLRLSYTIVYAPVFALIQGLHPLVLSRLAVQRSQLLPTRRTIARWIVLIAALTLTVAISAAGVGEIFHSPPVLVAAVSFLVPVGIFFAGGQILEAGLDRLRFAASSQVLHRLRLGIVSLDILVQAGLFYAFSVKGILWGMIALGAAKITLAIPLTYRRREVFSAESKPMIRMTTN